MIVRLPKRELHEMLVLIASSSTKGSVSLRICTGSLGPLLLVYTQQRCIQKNQAQFKNRIESRVYVSALHEHLALCTEKLHFVNRKRRKKNKFIKYVSSALSKSICMITRKVLSAE